MSSVQSASRMSTVRTCTPMVSSARQGETLASWSSTRDQHFVAGPQRAAQRTAQVKGVGGHVLAELDLGGRGRAQEVGHGGVGVVQHPVGLDGCLKRAAVVGVAAHQVIGHARHHLPRHLGAAGVVEENSARLERRELGPDLLDIEWHAMLLRIGCGSVP